MQANHLHLHFCSTEEGLEQFGSLTLKKMPQDPFDFNTRAHPA